MGDRILVTGPSRSGKSEWAEHLAQGSGQRVIYVATAQRSPDDAEWQARIATHAQRRPPDWITREEPIALAASLASATAQDCWLVDSLGTWVANTLDQPDPQWQHTQAELLHVLQQCPSTVILVAEETGWGVVPAYPLGRAFRDRLGTLTRQVGAWADRAYLVVAGYAIDLKAQGTAVPASPTVAVVAEDRHPRD